MSKFRLEMTPDEFEGFIETAILEERQRILDIIEEYKGKPDFTLDNLVHLIEHTGYTE